MRQDRRGAERKADATIREQVDKPRVGDRKGSSRDTLLNMLER